MKKLYPILLLAILAGCSKNQSKSKYLRWVGDSEFDAQIDAQDFTLCNGEQQVIQYFNQGSGLEFEGEKKKLKSYFLDNYKPVESGGNGWIRVRFIVNCKGETGRFRVISSDENYEEATFDEQITSQLLRLTKELEGWKIKSGQGRTVDYYQYLIFKIAEGQLIEIMP